MGAVYSHYQNRRYLDYIIDIDHAVDSKTLHRIYDQLIINLHWTDNGSYEEKLCTSLIDYINLKSQQFIE